LMTMAGNAIDALGRDLNAFSWEDWLYFVLPKISSSTAKALIQSGAFSWSGKSRKRMENEYNSISLLTERELKVLIDIHTGKQQPPPEPVCPIEEDGWLKQHVENWENLTKRQRTGRIKTLHKEHSEAREEYDNWQGHAGPFSDITAALRAVVAVGKLNPNRKEVLGSAAALLEKPPSIEQDLPREIARAEEYYLGVALTCTNVDAYDDSQTNCNCKDFINGRSGHIIMAVEVKSAREVTTKAGKNPGQKMAFLTIADSSAHLTDVCVFPSQWKAYSPLLYEGAIVLIEGERDRQRDSLIINQAYPLG
jgi:hypothetical protein